MRDLDGGGVCYGTHVGGEGVRDLGSNVSIIMHIKSNMIMRKMRSQNAEIDMLNANKMIIRKQVLR